jgi:hypothetical protein
MWLGFPSKRCLHKAPGNGLTECDPHHKAKHAILSLTRLEDGTHRWTLRTGHYADVPPRPLLRGW